MPSLRERPEDLPVLVDFFLARINRRAERRVDGVAPEVMSLFRRYDWPGNVRELENVLEGAAVMCRGAMVMSENLPLRLQNQVAAPDVTEGDTLAGILAGVEKRIIAEALALEENNRTRTAARLGITRKILLAEIAEYRLE